MTVLTIIVLLLIEAYAWFRYRDVISPAVMHNLLWIASLLGALTLKSSEEIRNVALLIICIGSVVFQVGYDFAIKSAIGLRVKACDYRVTFNKQMIKLLVIIIVLAVLPVIYQYYGYMRHSANSIYFLLRSADDDLQLPMLFKYFRKIVQCISLAVLAVYWRVPKIERKDIRKYVWSIVIIAILCVFSVPSRNGVLFYILPLGILYISTHNVSNKNIITMGVISVVGFMFVFYIISLGKYWYLYENASSAQAVLLDEIKTYLSGSIIALGKTVDTHAYSYLGQNTFRFFYVLIDRLFNSSFAVSIVNEFTSFGEGMQTNVYTFYDFYIRDYGVGYALLAQFIVGFIHGKSYKGAYRNNPFSLYMNSLLSYPLVMQFFQDQYLSLLSTWLQIILVGFIILKANIFVKVEPMYHKCDKE